MASIRILLIDDEESILLLSKKYLETQRENIKVETANSADKALATLEKKTFDVIVSDYKMPEKDGLELLSEIRGSGNETPFIIFTGQGREEVAIQALNLGADYYLQKGGEPKAQFRELVNYIDKLIEKFDAEKKTKRLLEQQLAINRLALTLSETRDPFAVYKAIYQHIQNLMDSQLFIISFLDKDTGFITAEYAVLGGKAIDCTVFPPLPLTGLNEGYQSRVFHTGMTIYIPDLIEQNSGSQYFLLNENEIVSKGDSRLDSHKKLTKSAIFAPIKIVGEIIGVMQVQSAEYNAFSHEDITILTAIANVAGVAIHNALLFRRQQEANLQLANEKGKTQRFLDIVGVAILLLDIEGNVKQINQYGCELLQTTADEIIGKNWLKRYVSAEMRDKIQWKLIRKVLQNKEELTSDLRCRFNAEIHDRLISWRVETTDQTNEHESLLLVSGLDVTDEIETKKKLLESQQRFERMFTNISDGIIILEDEKVILVNDNAAKILGYPKEDLYKMQLPDFVVEEDKEEVFRTIRGYREAGEKVAEIKFWIKQKSGFKRYIQVRYSAVAGKTTDRKVNLSEYIVISDITNQILSAEASFFSKENTKNIINAMIEPIHIISRDFRVIAANNTLCKWNKSLGFTSKPEGVHLFKVYPFLGSKVRKEYEEVFATAKELVTEEETFIGQQKIRTESRKIPIIRDGKVKQIITILRNITEHAQLMADLESSEMKYSILFSMSQDAIILHKTSGQITDFNIRSSKLFGLELEGINDISDIIPAKLLGDYRKEIKKVLQKGAGKFILEIPNVDGFVFPAEFSVNVISLSQERILQVQIRDITKQKKIEEDQEKDITNLRFLTEASIALLSEEKQESIHGFIGEKFREIIGNAVIVVTDYDKERDLQICRAVAGLGKFAKEIIKVLGRDPIGMEVPTIHPTTDSPKPGDIYRIPANIHEITKGMIPKATAKTFKKILGIERVYITPFVSHTGEAIGYAVFYLLKGTKLKNKKLIETFSSQASIALLRYQARKQLRASEEQFRDLLKTLNDGFFVADEKGVFSYVNDKFCSMLGVSRQDIIGRKPEHFLDKENNKIFQDQLEVRMQGKPGFYEIEWLQLDNSLLPVIHSCMPMMEGSNYKGCSTVVTDITERKKSQAKLEESEQRIRNIIEISPLAIMVTDIDGIIQTVNQKATTYLGFEKGEELVGLGTIGFIVEDEVEQVVQEFEKMVDSRQQIQLEANIKRKDGSIFLAQVYGSILLDSKGKPEGIIFIAEDITARKQNEKILEQQTKRLEKQKEELESFASTVSHDIRGKLQVLSLYNSLLETPESKKIAGIIDEISQFLENQLLLAKTGNILGEKTELNIEDLISDIVERVASINPKLVIELKNVPNIYGDKDRLHQVFENLMLNVVKHTNATKLTISGKQTKKYNKIFVKDNGQGISAKEQMEILKSLTTKKYTSFGLLIVMKIIKAHGGSVSIESELDKGTTFILEFPREKKKPKKEKK